MVKKLGNIVLIVGGLLAVVGGTIDCANLMFDMNIGDVFAMAVLARIGAIMLFVGAIGVLAAAYLTSGSKKGSTIAGAVARMFFGTAAFVGQFLINPFTSKNAMLRAIASAADKGFQSGSISSSDLADTLYNAAQYGFIIIAVSGMVLLIMGFEGVAPKKKKNTQ